MAVFSWRTLAIAAPAALALGSAVAIVWLCLPGTGEIRNSATAEVPEPVDIASIGHVPVDPADNAFEFYRKASLLVQQMSPAATEQHNDAALAQLPQPWS